MPFELLPEGSYRGTVTDSGWSQTNNGTPYFYLAARFEEAQLEDGSWEPAGPYRRDVKFWFTPKGTAMALKGLKFLGFQGSIDDLEAHNFRGKQLIINVTHKPDNQGRIQENINLSTRAKAEGDTLAKILAQAKEAAAEALADQASS